MHIALVTGASSGLGRAFVQKIAAQGAVDEIWAVARREDRLRRLGEETACPVRPVPMDLTDRESVAALKALLAEERPNIRMLVNAAGMGRMGKTADISDRDNGDMIALNCRAAVDVTAAALPYLSRGSRVLEVCSTAAFQPIPGLNVYAATKAFLLSYTKALHHEMLGSGVHVTAVCPYWIKDTEFISNAASAEGGFRHFPLASKAHRVARRALADSRLNLWVSTPGPVCALHRLAAKFIPHAIMVPGVDLLRRL
ncbi:MAG: SDR family NAD(P)-dependent oxidoreductase [Oscillospiraceae bacterium]|nr:SDR family NAD(P)-dependent oxidoreductase [Oscillospiraceae bacterium]